MLEMPIVAGAGGGVGATAVASALGAVDAGRYRAGQPVHVLVCRLTMASIGDAQRAIAAAPAAPVLAVVADIPRAGLTGGMRARLRMSESLVPATVMLPYVSGWRDVADPWTAAATWQQDPRPPRPMRAFVAAIQRLAAAVTPLLRPLATPSTPATAVAAQALAPAAVRSGTTPSAAMTAAAAVTGPAAAAVIAARGVTGPSASAAGRGGRAALPAPVRPGPPVPVRPVVRNPTRGR
jgi:hypothetical protein